MRKNLIFVFVALVAISMSSCVSTRKYTNAKLRIGNLRADSMRLSRSLQNCKVKNGRLNTDVDSLDNRLQQFIQAAKSQISNQKNKISHSQKKIAKQQKKLAELQEIIDKQRAITKKLHQSISKALMGFDPDELTVTRKNGKVYVSMQEKLLFKSASARVGTKGKEALAKVAEVLNKNKEIEIDIEGHTDSIPITGVYRDNWALSLARAASVVRILTRTYDVNPSRVIASGHSKFDPVDTNNTKEGRAHNRRTDIILSPNLDELYQLINGAENTNTEKTQTENINTRHSENPINQT